ncbi:MAG: class I SAM-dependent rRNA methyltransferase [Alphaproteobacteria bacterium]|nr:class I SAM-dependent rRNA methyltransferase [Alphaproteobacteria bacterium]
MRNPIPLAADRPRVRLLPEHDRRVAGGFPWAFSNEVAMDAATKALPPGGLVVLETARGAPVGVAMFNPHSLIAARLLAPEIDAVIDADFLAARLQTALALRARLYALPYYRLVHAEADGLPGLIVDRYGDVVVCQINSAGMERLRGEVQAALQGVLAPRALVLRADRPVRALEGLADEDDAILGELDNPVALVENGARFRADVLGGQKTGWFFDHRDNRAFIAPLCRGGRVLDLYGYTGGFAVQAAMAGATEVLAIDRSEPALALAAQAATENGVAPRCRFERGEVFGALERLAAASERFDVVIADPPAFVKSRKELNAGARGYRKLARGAARLVASGGLLLIASCSHLVDMATFGEEVRRGLRDVRRAGRIIRSGGAGPDHPIHPALAASAYLKCLVLALD